MYLLKFREDTMKRKILYLFLSTKIILCNILFNCFVADVYFAGVNKDIPNV